MNRASPFTPADLDELGQFFAQADRVVPMRDVFMGDRDPKVIGLRHDVDDNPGSFATALKMAQWEFDHGYSSTYFLLHGSYYWDEALCMAGWFEELGHEVGIHVNAIAEALRQRKPAHMILARALHELRNAGVRVVGSVAHGDPLCHKAHFVNDEMLRECARPNVGASDRLIEYGGVVYPLEPLPMDTYQLEYDANWLPRGDYISDSGGRWNPREDSFDRAVDHSSQAGQLHMLIHPDWWGEAFVPVEVAA